MLPHVKFLSSGVAGEPTVRFSGVNVQVVSGSGSTAGAVNGEGNVVLGYDENPGKVAQSGSHDLVLGMGQSFTSYGGLLGGNANVASGSYAAVLGRSNAATGTDSAVDRRVWEQGLWGVFVGQRRLL
jgi:hypothetical protein